MRLAISWRCIGTFFGASMPMRTLAAFHADYRHGYFVADLYALA
jgi:hypothetical protein